MLTITKGKQQRAQRVVLFALEGVGKSTFASKLPAPLFIDTEKGSDHLDVTRAQVSSFKEIREACKRAATSKEFKSLVIDTADGAEDLLIKEICKAEGVIGIEDVAGGFGKGYVQLAEKWGEFLHKDLDAVITAGVHVVLLVHATARKFTEPGKDASYDRYELAQSKQGAPLTKGWADEVWFANYKTTIIEEKGKATVAAGGKERILHTSHTPAFDAKTRSGLPERIPMEFANVASVFAFSSKPAAPAGRIGPVDAGVDPVKPAPEVKEPEDKIPMGDAPVEPEVPAHPLDKVVKGNEEKANAFLWKHGEIAQGETYRNADEEMVQKILSKPAAFLAAISK